MIGELGQSLNKAVIGEKSSSNIVSMLNGFEVILLAAVMYTKSGMLRQYASGVKITRIVPY